MTYISYLYENYRSSQPEVEDLISGYNSFMLLTFHTGKKIGAKTCSINRIKNLHNDVAVYSNLKQILSGLRLNRKYVQNQA